MKRILRHQDHSSALSRLEELMVSDPAIGSVEEKELVDLAQRIDLYERENTNIPKPTSEGGSGLEGKAFKNSGFYSTKGAKHTSPGHRPGYLRFLNPEP